MSNNSVFIKKMILHILDSTLGMPILSDEEHTLNTEINEFISKHIIKILKDTELKESKFIDSDDNIIKSLINDLTSDMENFTGITKQISKIFYDIMIKYPDVPSADLVYCLADIDESKYLAIIKFNYKPSYIHYVNSNEDIKVNSIIKQKTTLPSENQKVDECVLINLENLSIKLKEKKFEIDGGKKYYLSSLVFKCTGEPSDKEKVNIIDKAAKKIIKEYYDEDHSKLSDIRQAVVDSIEEKEEIDLVDITNKVFQAEDIKDTYIKEVKDKGLKNNIIKLNKETGEKLFRKERFLTDNGIEIKVPIEFINRKDKVEFINNADGTISILIKNIDKISSK